MAGDAAFRFRYRLPVIESECHRFTLTRLPVPLVLVPFGTALTGPVGVAPDPSAPNHSSVSRSCLRIRLPRRLAVTSPRGRSERSSRSPLSTVTRRPGLTQRPSQLPAPNADSSLHPVTRMPGLRWPMYLSSPDPAECRGRCGLGRSPLLTAPVRLRCSERCSVNTTQNPRSRGIFKITGLSPKLLRYPQVSSCRPPIPHRSCTEKCTEKCTVWPGRLILGVSCGFNGVR